jgi:hypothetical protein
MIDATKIRSKDKLTEILNDLEFFIKEESLVRSIYREDYNWGDTDFDDDLELVVALRDNIKNRLVALDTVVVPVVEEKVAEKKI